MNTDDIKAGKSEALAELRDEVAKQHWMGLANEDDLAIQTALLDLVERLREENERIRGVAEKTVDMNFDLREERDELKAQLEQAELEVERALRKSPQLQRALAIIHEAAQELETRRTPEQERADVVAYLKDAKEWGWARIEDGQHVGAAKLEGT